MALQHVITVKTTTISLTLIQVQLQFFSYGICIITMYLTQIILLQECTVKTSKGSLSVLVCGDQEKPALITYPDVALNCNLLFIVSCFFFLYNIFNMNVNMNALFSHKMFRDSVLFSQLDFGLLQMCLVSRACCSAQMQLLCCFITSAFITLMLLGMRSVLAFSPFFPSSKLCMRIQAPFNVVEI